MVKQSPYGTWKSPISSNDLIQDSTRYSFLHATDSKIICGEGRPKEKGRTVLQQISFDNAPKDILPKEFNVRSKVHEYGGKSFTLHNEFIYFVNLDDQDIYRLDPDQTTHRITTQSEYRFGDLTVSSDGRFLFCVAEKHHESHVDNMLVRVCLNTNAVEIIASGYDFYASPVVSFDSKKIAWICWNQPNMPWDETELYIANISDKKGLDEVKLIDSSASIIEPQFSKKGVLHFLSDRSGFWNLYTYENEASHPVYPVDFEIGGPQWVFGLHDYTFLENGHIACIGTKKAVDSLYVIDPFKKKIVRLETPFTSLADLYLVKDTLVFKAASPMHGSCIATYHLKNKHSEIIKEFGGSTLDEGYISIPEAVSFPTDGNKTAYGFYYPPKNKDFRPLDGEKPPVIVCCHGGPTAHVSPVMKLSHLFYTTRGYAVFELNYSGSTGYGTEYRNRLRKNWGIVDIQDCENAVLHLAKKGLCDKDKTIIKGGSAGGFSVLGALTFTDAFKAGACYYGVADMEALAKDTHKFEARYLDLIVGPYPKDKKTYIERSPIKHTEKLSCPIIFFQGADDKVVPPAQSEMMVEALREKKIPVSYLLFEKEAHGFRMAENIKKAAEAELYFFSKIFGIECADKLEPVHIENF